MEISSNYIHCPWKYAQGFSVSDQNDHMINKFQTQISTKFSTKKIKGNSIIKYRFTFLQTHETERQDHSWSLNELLSRVGG